MIIWEFWELFGEFYVRVIVKPTTKHIEIFIYLANQEVDVISWESNKESLLFRVLN
jgi:hypothetical protein